jgi:hypothetical protein
MLRGTILPENTPLVTAVQPQDHSVREKGQGKRGSGSWIRNSRKDREEQRIVGGKRGPSH